MKLYLVDSSIYVFKAWFSARLQMLNANGEINHAFIGFSDFVYQLLTEIAPANLVFAFDKSQKHSQRKQIYPDYKANRSRAPEELKRQFGWCRDWLEALGISCIDSHEWEADDLIGSLAALHRSPELAVVFLSADKDLTQLVREGDIWWPFYDSKKLDYAAIRKKFGVRPEQIADQLALTGDKVDNIPGIPLIGRKTAANLLRKFDNLDTLRKNLSLIGKMKFRYASQVQQSLLKHQSILDISAPLARINCDIEAVKDIPINRQSIQKNRLRQLIQEHAMDTQRKDKWESFLATTNT